MHDYIKLGVGLVAVANCTVLYTNGTPLCRAVRHRRDASSHQRLRLNHTNHPVFRPPRQPLSSLPSDDTSYSLTHKHMRFSCRLL
jgi:hypothetical protein